MSQHGGSLRRDLPGYHACVCSFRPETSCEAPFQQALRDPVLHVVGHLDGATDRELLQNFLRDPDRQDAVLSLDMHPSRIWLEAHDLVLAQDSTLSNSANSPRLRSCVTGASASRNRGSSPRNEPTVSGVSARARRPKPSA